MQLITWENKFSVGIMIIDEQHKVLVDLINQLYSACISTGEDADMVFKKTIKDCVDYVKVHFTMEEGLMTTYNYVDIVAHKKQHTEFVVKVLHEALQFDTKGRNAASNFVRYLRDWLLGHIAITDKKFGAFLQSNGVL